MSAVGLGKGLLGKRSLGTSGRERWNIFLPGARAAIARGCALQASRTSPRPEKDGRAERQESPAWMTLLNH